MGIVDRVIGRLKTMSPEQQKYVADMLDGLIDAGPAPVEITSEEQAIVDRALAEIDAGHIATDEEVATYRNRIL